MKKLATGALLAGLLAACGGGGGGGDDGPILIDADNTNTIDASPAACNPVAQTGCANGEKCTWRDVTDTLGEVACVPAGSVAEGGACTFMPPGENAGYDDCAAGLYCLGGSCAPICTNAPDSCDTAVSACALYSGLFEGVTPALGVCDPKCDPVTQNRLTDNGANCGGTEMSPKGCYYAGDFTCARVPEPARGLVQDSIAYGPMAGSAYVNGCAAGYAPLLGDPNTDDVLCQAFCEAGETHSGQTQNEGGLSTSSFKCSDRNALTEACQFFWFILDTPEQYPDRIGFCWKPENYQYDSDGDNMADTPFPRCSTLPNTDTDGNMTPDHLEFACAPYPTMATGEVKRHKAPFRVVDEESLRNALPR